MAAMVLYQPKGVTTWVWGVLPQQVPAEPVCQDVFGPTVPGNQQDFWPAGCGPDLAMHVR